MTIGYYYLRAIEEEELEKRGITMQIVGYIFPLL